MNDSAQLVCKTCRRVLDYLPASGRWQHSLASMLDTDWKAHEPVPVPAEALEDVKYHCDFCYVERPTWAIPAKSFNTRLGGRSVGDWYACDSCTERIRRQDWEGLLRRAKAAWKRRHGVALHPIAAEIVESTYAKLRHNITGPPKKL